VYPEFDLPGCRMQERDRLHLDRGNMQHVSVSLEPRADVSRLSSR
jgi:hypothetical protein